MIVIHQKWVSTETKRLYNNIKQDMNPYDFKYEDIQQQFVHILNLDRDENKLNFFSNEIMNEKNGTS